MKRIQKRCVDAIQSLHFIRVDRASVKGMFLYKTSTTETENPVFLLLDNDLMVGNY